MSATNNLYEGEVQLLDLNELQEKSFRALIAAIKLGRNRAVNEREADEVLAKRLRVRVDSLERDRDEVAKQLAASREAAAETEVTCQGLKAEARALSGAAIAVRSRLTRRSETLMQIQDLLLNDAGRGLHIELISRASLVALLEEALSKRTVPVRAAERSADTPNRAFLVGHGD